MTIQSPGKLHSVLHSAFSNFSVLLFFFFFYKFPSVNILEKKSHVYVEDFTKLTDWLEPFVCGDQECCKFRDQLFSI